MKYRESRERIVAYRQEIAGIRRQMQALQSQSEPEPVADYELETTASADSPSPVSAVHLSALFGAKRELIVIHSMGISCPYCTAWCDGYNGVYHHLQNRAAFVVIGPDAPEAQLSFARGRGWRFPLASHRNSTFAADMGYRTSRGAYVPGLSVFRMEQGEILRIADAAAKPGDDFNPLCRVFDMLPGGWEDWTPRFSYDD